MKAIPVYVYYSPILGDCTNGGVTCRFNRLLVECEDGYVDIDEHDLPDNLMKVVKRTMRGKDIYHLEPVAAPHGAGWMAGGNYAGSCDDRFSRMVGGQYGAIPVHDRQESWDEYESNFH